MTCHRNFFYALFFLFLQNLKRIKAQSCGGELSGFSGEITSPGWPGQYPDNSDCTWIINTPSPDSQITVSIVDLAIENGPDCQYDYLEIAISNRDPIKLCSYPNWQEQGIQVGSGRTFINFHSDDSVNQVEGRGGFDLVFESEFYFFKNYLKTM